jgi:hypothetical protein
MLKLHVSTIRRSVVVIFHDHARNVPKRETLAGKSGTGRLEGLPREKQVRKRRKLLLEITALGPTVDRERRLGLAHTSHQNMKGTIARISLSAWVFSPMRGV